MDTPDLWGGSKWLITFELPQSRDLEKAVKGQFALAAFLDYWQESGTATPEDCSQALTRSLISWRRTSPMIGAISAYLGAFPEHVLGCDGTTYNRADYPELWELMPAASKTATEFTLPDLRQKFLLGEGGGRLSLETGGEERVTLSISEMPSHDHATLPHTHSVSGASPSIGEISAGVPFTYAIATPQVTAPSSVEVLSTGGGASHENMPPYTVIRWGVVAR